MTTWREHLRLKKAAEQAVRDVKRPIVDFCPQALQLKSGEIENIEQVLKLVDAHSSNVNEEERIRQLTIPILDIALYGRDFQRLIKPEIGQVRNIINLDQVFLRDKPDEIRVEALCPLEQLSTMLTDGRLTESFLEAYRTKGLDAMVNLFCFVRHFADSGLYKGQISNCHQRSKVLGELLWDEDLARRAALEIQQSCYDDRLKHLLHQRLDD